MRLRFKKNSFLFIVILLASTHAFATKYTSHWDLNWANNDITFDGAEFIGSSASLPYFTYSFETTANVTIYPSLNHVDWEQYNTRAIPTSNDISNSVTINHYTERAQNKYIHHIYFVPVIKEGTNYKKLESFTLNVNAIPNQNLKTSLAYSNILNGESAKIKIQEDGIYKITYDDIVAWGIQNPQYLKVWTTPQQSLAMKITETSLQSFVEIPLSYNLGEDNIFNSGDYILFYGSSPHTWYYDETDRMFHHKLDEYNDYNNYIITASTQMGKTIENQNSLNITTDTTVTTYTAVDFYENEESNIATDAKGTGRRFFEPMTEIIADFSFPNIVTNANHILYTNVLSNYSGTYGIYLNNSLLKNETISAPGEHYYAREKATKQNFTTTSESFSVKYLHNNYSYSTKMWLDYAEINAKCNLKYSNQAMIFRNSESFLYNNNAQFKISSDTDISIWDITDVTNYKSQSHSFTNGYISFNQNTETLKTYIAFSGNDYKSPEFVELISSQNLHSLSNIENIIIAHENYHEQAQRLKDLHDNEGISTYIVQPKQIYNEFSCGKVHPSAIRNFLSYLYNKSINSNHRLQYVTLIGDGSYENRNLDINSALIPTYQSYESISVGGSLVSDDYYAILNIGEGEENNGSLIGGLDIGCGRLPVNNVDELTIIVDKIINYSTNPDCRKNWRNTITFLADDQEDDWEFSFVTNSEKLADTIAIARPAINFDKIYVDAYKQTSTSGGERYPDANTAINERIKKGTLVFHYTGHGSEYRMGYEVFVSNETIQEWDNFDKLPLFITASCEVSRFDNHAKRSLGEELLLLPQAGAIALISTTREVADNANYTLSHYIYKSLVNRNVDGTSKTLGQISMESKNTTSSISNKRKFILLGDPALKLAIPELDVVVDKINNTAASECTDTLSALSEFTIEGHIQNISTGNIDNYSGHTYIELFDKPQQLQTLNNEGFEPLNFNIQKNKLIKGKLSVSNGKFKGTYLIPKDIAYNFGNGKFSFYFDNGTLDGNGSFSEIVVGGSNDTIINDSKGPEISLFMNDSSFVFGGTTNQSPILLAKVYDQTGINLSGVNIGHDATTTLDNGDIKILNDFFEPDLNTYKSGTFEYPYSKLEEGKHTVKVKIWDAVNNSGEETLEFFVTSSAEIALKHILNYPNPFTTSTEFLFEHNQYNTNLEVLVQIFTVSGKLVKTLESSFYANGFRNIPIHWDGLDDYGSRIGRGVYIYKITVRNEQMQQAEAFEKLVILK